MTVLLDANVLIALLVEDHVHHDAAENWFAGISGNFATCPVTQGSLIRLLIREGQPASAAREILNGTAADPRHEFCPDDVPYTNVPTEGIIGHRQVTDAYLAQLARAHGFRLATFDQAMAKLHHDVAELVPDRLPSKVPGRSGRRSAVQDEGFLLLELGLSQHARRQQLAELLQLGEPVTHVGWLRRDSRYLRWRDRLGVGLLRLCRGRVLRWRRGGHSYRIGLALRCPPLLLPALNPAVHGAGDRDGGGGLK